MGKEEKQFPLDSKKNCCIYLCRIISSCELCMDKFKMYNNQAKDVLAQYKSADTIPFDVYSEMCDKTSNVMCYLLNLLGDAQTSSISYFKYRQAIQKRIKKGSSDITLSEISGEISELILEFNKLRNWLNHVPESLLVAEMERVEAGIMTMPMDPVEITQYKSVTYEYYEDLYLSNVAFYKTARKIIQAVKREYSLLMGNKIMYPRVYIETPLGVEKNEPAKQSARVQGLRDVENKGEKPYVGEN